MRPLRPLAIACALCALAACKKSEGHKAASDTIVLGEVGSLTGDEATFGQSTKKGIDLALADANARGGVKGKKLEVIVYDDQSKAEEANTAATRLIAQEHVKLLLGEVASTRSLAMAPIAEANKIPMITPSSTNPKVTVTDDGKTREYVFRVCFIDPFQGTVMAKFARETLKLDNVAILRDVGSDYSMGLADYFKQKFTELGGKVVADESFKSSDPDFKAQLTALKAANPEGIYVPAYYNAVALIVRQARELGMTVPLMGGDGWDSAKLYQIGGKALDGCYFSNHYSPEDPNPRIQEFVGRYKAAYGEVPDSLAAMGYDGAGVAIDAMRRAPDLSGPALARAIAATKGFEGVTGTITINDKHNAVKPAVVLKIEGGKPHYVTTIAP